jgi:hypothetical protein
MSCSEPLVTSGNTEMFRQFDELGTRRFFGPNTVILFSALGLHRSTVRQDALLLIDRRKLTVPLHPSPHGPNVVGIVQQTFLLL